MHPQLYGSPVSFGALFLPLRQHLGGAAILILDSEIQKSSCGSTELAGAEVQQRLPWFCASPKNQPRLALGEPSTQTELLKGTAGCSREHGKPKYFGFLFITKELITRWRIMAQPGSEETAPRFSLRGGFLSAARRGARGGDSSRCSHRASDFKHLPLSPDTETHRNLNFALSTACPVPAGSWCSLFGEASGSRPPRAGMEKRQRGKQPKCLPTFTLQRQLLLSSDCMSRASPPQTRAEQPSYPTAFYTRHQENHEDSVFIWGNVSLQRAFFLCAIRLARGGCTNRASCIRLFHLLPPPRKETQAVLLCRYFPLEKKKLLMSNQASFAGCFTPSTRSSTHLRHR